MTRSRRAGRGRGYHDLIQVEKSFRMTKTDLRARPILRHNPGSIAAHLTIVGAALAIARDVQNRTGASIRRIVHELKPPRDVTINALGHYLTAATPPGPDAAAIPDALRRTRTTHQFALVSPVAVSSSAWLR